MSCTFEVRRCELWGYPVKIGEAIKMPWLHIWVNFGYLKHKELIWLQTIEIRRSSNKSSFLQQLEWWWTRNRNITVVCCVVSIHSMSKWSVSHLLWAEGILFSTPRSWVIWQMEMKCWDKFSVPAKRSSIEDLVLMRTMLLKWSSFSPHFTQKASFSPIMISWDLKLCSSTINKEK